MKFYKSYIVVLSTATKVSHTTDRHERLLIPFLSSTIYLVTCIQNESANNRLGFLGPASKPTDGLVCAPGLYQTLWFVQDCDGVHVCLLALSGTLQPSSCSRYLSESHRPEVVLGRGTTHRHDGAESVEGRGCRDQPRNRREHETHSPQKRGKISPLDACKHGSPAEIRSLCSLDLNICEEAYLSLVLRLLLRFAPSLARLPCARSSCTRGKALLFPRGVAFCRLQ